MATEMDRLLAEYRAACDAFGACHAERLEDEERSAYRAAEKAYLEACAAIRGARPTDPAGIAQQLRWILEPDQEDLYQPPLDLILEHVADQLEAMAAQQAA